MPQPTIDLSRFRLPWAWADHGRGVAILECRVPVLIHRAERGVWLIWFMERPYYCDRGRWHCCVDGVGVEGPDHGEGFPRYFFSLERGIEELEEWVKIRSEVKAAIVRPVVGPST